MVNAEDEAFLAECLRFMTSYHETPASELVDFHKVALMLGSNASHCEDLYTNLKNNYPPSSRAEDLQLLASCFRCLRQEPEIDFARLTRVTDFDNCEERYEELCQHLNAEEEALQKAAKLHQETYSAAIREMDFSKTFTIVLADVDKTFVVHEQPFIAESLFLRRAIAPGFAESQEGEVVIQETDDVESMNMILTWVYGKYAHGHGISQIFTMTHANSSMSLVKLYLLADKLVMYNLKNEITDAYREMIGETLTVDSSAAALLFEEGHPESKLREVFAHHIARFVQANPSVLITATKDIVPQQEGLPITTLPILPIATLLREDHDLTMLVLIAVTASRGKDPLRSERCYYHEHPEGFERCT